MWSQNKSKYNINIHPNISIMCGKPALKKISSPVVSSPRAGLGQRGAYCRPLGHIFM